jgi:uncharacterized membrane protein
VLTISFLLALYVLGIAGYAWSDRRRGTSDRYLVAGGVSLVAASVPLLLVGVATDVFSLALASGDHQALRSGWIVLMVALVAGPIALITLGLRAAFGSGRAALAAAVLTLGSYAVPVASVVPFPHSSTGMALLVPGSIGLLPAASLVIGLRSRGTKNPG